MPATPAWPPKSAPRLFVAPTLVEGEARVIDGNAAHYLASVMRVTVGDVVILCDDASGEWAARVEAVGKRAVTLIPERLLRPREPVPDLWLCLAPLRKPHFDLVLEKATELGVDRIVPVLMRRSVVDKVNGERATSIVTEAAEQCARTALPVVADLVTLKALLADWPPERTLFFADEAAVGDAAIVGASTAFAETTGPAALLIGPEGGFDPAERAMLHALPSARAVSLGPRILRAETAAIAAVTLWMAVAGDWLGASSPLP